MRVEETRIAVRFYCGINDETWNKRPVRPGNYSCVSPVYGRTERTKRDNRVKLPEHTEIIQDSGAFSDGPGSRLSFQEALDRQEKHGQRYDYDGQITHRASYDLLIDEKWQDGKRSKQRWTEAEAAAAVEETIQAARFMRQNYSGPSVLSAQGVSPAQYLECVTRIVSLVRPGIDILGLGGWCVSGIFPLQMRPVFNATMTRVIPFAAKSGVTAVHIWGVSDVTFLGPLLWLCDRYGLKLSTDSSAPQSRPVRGAWGFRGWYKEDPQYKRPPVEVRGLHRAILVQLFRCRLNTLRQSEFYHHPDMPDGYGRFDFYGESDDEGLQV